MKTQKRSRKQTKKNSYRSKKRSASHIGAGTYGAGRGLSSPEFAPEFPTVKEWPLWVSGVVVLGLILRLIFLEWKSPHFDESINGHFVIQIWNTGSYPYDPTNFHGPLYFYLLHLGELLFGRGIFAFRVVTGLLSAAVVFVVASHARYLGRAAFWAALLVALSPAMVFYGRYAIHETLFILSQLVFSYGFLKWRFEGGSRAVIYMITGTAAAIATKETFFIFTGTWLIAWTMVKVAESIWPSRTEGGPEGGTGALLARPVGGAKTWISVSLVAAFVTGALFSGFFARPQGLWDMIAAYSFWTKTGTGATGHDKPFFYWLQLLARYEWPTLLALIVAPIACFFGSAWMRLFTLVGFGSWLAYSIIPYKTPWCVIGVIWPLAFAFGFLITETRASLMAWISKSNLTTKPMWHLMSRPITLGLIPVVLLAASTFTMLRLSFRDFEKGGEPYVYVQSTQDVNRVMRLLEERSRLHPEDRNMRIQVLNKDPWPFPWLLSLFPSTEFGKVQHDTVINGDVVFVDHSDVVEVERRISRRYWRRPLSIRDSYEPGYAYFDYDRFNDLMPSGSESVEPRNTTPVPINGLRGPASENAK